MDERSNSLRKTAQDFIKRRLSGEFKSIDENVIIAAAKALDGVGVPTLLATFEPERMGGKTTDEEFIPQLAAAYRLAELREF